MMSSFCVPFSSVFVDLLQVLCLTALAKFSLHK